MKPGEPPAIAKWMLEHLVPGPRNDALAGDLFEDFGRGRPKGWYWRQVLSVILLGMFREARIRFGLVFFAASWSMLVPAWLRLLNNFEQHSNLTERFGRMDWPWSVVSDVGFLLAANVVFIWIGMTMYLVPHLWAARNLRVQPLGRGIRASLPILVALWALLVLVPKYFLGQPVDRPAATPVETYRINEPGPIVGAGTSSRFANQGSTTSSKRHMMDYPPPSQAELIRQHQQWVAEQRPTAMVQISSPSAGITDVRPAAIAVRLPFFLILIGALWKAASRFESREHRIVG